MPDALQKGWLTTRDGQKYAPATLVENVYTRSGKPYDERVREYIQGLKSTSSTSIAALQTSVQEHDKEIEALQNKTIYFNGDASDKLFIVDSKENVIAYIDGNGVNSVDFNSPTYGVSLSGVKNSITAVNNELASLRAEIETGSNDLNNLNVEDSDRLFIIDSKENVIAYIDGTGIHSINFFVDEKQEGAMDYWTAIRKLTQCIIDLDAVEANVATFEKEVDNRLQNFDGNSDGNKLFIVDQKNNVIAYVDGTGMHSINFSIDDESGIIYSVKTTIEELLQADIDLESALKNLINIEAEARAAADAGLSSAIDGLGKDIDNLETKTKNLDSNENTDGLFIVDSVGNVVAFVDNSGITTIDIVIKTLKQDDSGFWSVVSGDVSNNVSTSLSQKLVEILNNRIADASDIATLKSEVSNIKLEYKPKQTALDSGAAETNEFVSRIEQNANGVITVIKSSVDLNNYYTKSQMDATLTPIQEKLINVSNVMDFKGAYPELPTITIGDEDLFQNGDVIVVTSGVDKGKEFVCYNKIWIEFGNSDATSIAIANLQSIVGHSGALPSGESSHHVQLESHSTRIENLEETFEDIEADVANLQDWQENWDVTAGNNVEDKIYFIDSKDNVIAYLDNDGLTVTNINLRTPNVSSEETANAVGWSTNNMIFFKPKGTITIDDSIL